MPPLTVPIIDSRYRTGLIQPATPKVQGETPEGTVIDSVLKSVIAKIFINAVINKLLLA